MGFEGRPHTSRDNTLGSKKYAGRRCAPSSLPLPPYRRPRRFFLHCPSSRAILKILGKCSHTKNERLAASEPFSFPSQKRNSPLATHSTARYRISARMGPTSPSGARLATCCQTCNISHPFENKTLATCAPEKSTISAMKRPSRHTSPPRPRSKRGSAGCH